MLNDKKFSLSRGLWTFLLMMTCLPFAFADKADAQFQLFQDSHAVSTQASQTGVPVHPPAKENQSQADKDEPADVEEEQALMENALDILEVADDYWKKGDIENTLNELDKAYALLLDTNGDVEIARQKDDLRLLISQRIMAVYSSKRGPTNGKASEIQLIMNPDVEKEIRSFQGPEREFFTASYMRSGLYRELIVSELKKAGIPEELFWLPLVESGFKVGAYSPARALGLWQFIPSTGYKYGLTRDEWVDERMDVLKSTQAAIAYLKELHAMFGDWLTVLAAYNCGEGRVLRVISRQHINYFDRFWDLYSQLPHETARYVPRFLATLHIVRNPRKYGFELQTTMDTLMNYETVKVNKMMKLSEVASKMEVSEDYINVLNAELRYKITPDREYDFKVPEGFLQKFQMVYNDIPAAEKPGNGYAGKSKNGGASRYIRHRVQPGETVASIAKRYRVSRQAIYSCNRINRNKRLIQQTRYVRIPIQTAETATVRQKTSVEKSSPSSGSMKSYKVRKGDTLFRIATRYNVPVDKLRQVNRLKTNTIKYGMTLKIPDQG
ncbi:MAG TPA: transglycosylase SLT domain-containing protein [Smithellaceae bacterium]|nr:transglycosylase SLT domain-containing protein [Smithellaceae bacterium]